MARFRGREGHAPPLRAKQSVGRRTVGLGTGRGSLISAETTCAHANGGRICHGLSSWLRVKYTDQGRRQAAAIFARSRVGHDAPLTWCVVASPGASLAAARRGAFPARWRNIAFGPLFC